MNYKQVEAMRRKKTTGNPWREYERRKMALPPMPADEYEDAIRKIAQDLGLDGNRAPKYFA